MTSLPDKLRAKLARDHDPAVKEVLTEIHNACIECVEALERARAQWMHSVNEKACKQALAHVAKVLEE